jgi:NAD(P)-dependent dehydrogenase (short-subunit alcohol dehydrogenase family)
MGLSEGKRRVTGKRVTVTAAAQGIGHATAEAFAREGAQVLLATDDMLRMRAGHGRGVPSRFVYTTTKAAVIGTPEEIADLAVYLATATYTTGQCHIIDGGWAV